MSLIAVVDTETTGVGELDQVVEIAVAWIDPALRAPPRGDWRWTSLVRPSVPVSAEGRAAHHISDAQLLRAPTVEALLKKKLGLRELRERGDVVFAAHNAEFDRRMLLQSGVPTEFLPTRTICTWRCALHLFPDAPRHSNQVLRYHLGLRIPDLPSLPPHRALPDAVVTAALLCRMLETHSVEDLVRLTTEPVLLTTVRFGKHRGAKWADMDHGYLSWVLSKDFDVDVMHTARHYLNR